MWRVGTVIIIGNKKNKSQMEVIFANIIFYLLSPIIPPIIAIVTMHLGLMIYYGKNTGIIRCLCRSYSGAAAINLLLKHYNIIVCTFFVTGWQMWL